LPLLDSKQTKQELSRRRKEILGTEQEFPDGSNGTVKERTLRQWVEQYRKFGFGGLFYGRREPKMSKGICKSIPSELLAVARDLREEDAGRSVDLILQIMQEGKELDVSSVNPRTLQRYFKQLGLRKGKSQKGKGQHERWEQERANALWHGDTAHTFVLPDPCNPKKVKKAKLIVFVDDATRVCVHGEFFFDEQLPSVLDTLAKGLLLRGKPERILLDNAQTFRSTTLELMCAELDIGLAFCRPRRPQGKGKIERFIRNCKESFISEAKKAASISTLEDLNAAFQGWLERYGNRVHSDLDGLCPEARWRKEEHQIDRSLTEQQIRQAMMLRASRIVQYSTGLISLNNREYQASRELAGLEIQIRWNPERCDEIHIWRDGRYLETAILKERKPNVERDWRTDGDSDSMPKQLDSASEYCAALMKDRVSERVRARNKDDVVRLEDFSELLARGVRPFESEEEQEQIAEHFKRFAPLVRSRAEETIAQVVAEKGSDRSLRVYLERLEPKAFRR
jgi:transposase InsO family protein